MKANFHSQIDHYNPSQLKEFQVALLQKHLEYILSNSPFYQKKLNPLQNLKASFLSDLSNFPRTSKSDLSTYNSEFLSIPSDQVVEYVTTSGTTGKPVVIALSRNDLDRLRHNEVRSLMMAGFSEKDTVQIATTLDRTFMAGMAYYMGLTEIGSAAVRAGIGSPEFHWETIAQMNPTGLIAVPSFLEKLGKYPNRKSHQIKKALCIGEPLRNWDFSENRLAKNISESWDLDLRSTYASTEMATAFTECHARKGGHLLPELIIVEILDEEGTEVPDGTLGEITVTPLGVEAMPLLRYRTGDLARKHSEPCSCGRTTPRLGPIEGRLSQMIKFKGTTLFPSQIEEILNGYPEASPFIIGISQDNNGMDKVSVTLPDTVNNLELERLKNILQAKLRVKPFILQETSEKIYSILFRNNSRKPQKIMDLRNA